MAEIKTKATSQKAEDYLQTIEPENRRREGLELLKIFEKVTGEKAVMWGTSIVGFGKYHYKSERSTQEGDWPLTGFSPRKQKLSLYVLVGAKGQEELLNKLGKHSAGKGCLYLNKLSDVDISVLEKLIENAYKTKRA